MGAGSSKTTGGPSDHVFAAQGPVSFSQSMIDSLQNSPESDSTRSRTLDLQVQQRVAAELERIRDDEASRLSSLTERLTSETSDDADDDSASSPSLGQKIASALTPGSSSQKPGQSRDSVSAEVAALKAKLEKRRKLEKVDPAVDKAKEGLVSCLRMNDRKPLDCWQEVETFKAEVAKLEQKFVDRAMR